MRIAVTFLKIIVDYVEKRDPARPGFCSTRKTVDSQAAHHEQTRTTDVRCSSASTPISSGRSEVMRGLTKARFRVGCTSYVYPDDILPNARRMAPLVDDIELVLFESDDVSNLPGAKVIQQLMELGLEHDCTYTVHFPIDRKAGSSDPSERRALVEQIQRIVALTEPLKPFAYLIHLEDITNAATQKARELWEDRTTEVCKTVVETCAVDPCRFCVENLNYPIAWHAGLVNTLGVSLCLDMGHLWLYSQTWESDCRTYLPHARVVHLHGVRDNTDHLALSVNSTERTDTFFSLLEEYRYNNLVTLEVFNEHDTFDSIDVVKRRWA